MSSKRWVWPATMVGYAAAAVVLAAGVVSCGGGGGSGETEQSAAASGTGLLPSAASPAAAAVPVAGLAMQAGADLIISEVATSYFSNDIAWLEVFNPTPKPLSLSRYLLRAPFIDGATGTVSPDPIQFALPDVAVPAGGYLLIGGRTSDALVDTPQMVHVKSGTKRPYWNASGMLELVASGVTVDFVRFGTASDEPLSPEAWSGLNVTSLPTGPDQHGKSIVRPALRGMADTNSASDWVLVNFATPAGLNDVAPGTVDSDLDGIPDSAKVPGGTYAGLDLYAMGARPGRRDIFLEIDHMSSDDVATVPRREALQKMEKAFAEKGIAMHMDAGNLYSAQFDPASYHLGGGNAVPFAACVELDTSEAGAGARPGCTSFQAIKTSHFDMRRRLVFHYALFANSLNIDGGAGPSGISEMSGNDLIVTLGGYEFFIDSDIGLNMLINMQASTLMHEFGHNLGLRHGGNEDVNYKPNHYSIMNYMYQFAGLSDTPDSKHAADRYYLANGLKGVDYCDLAENSPCSDRFRMSYSDGSGKPLDESRLSEVDNIGRGSTAGAYADWDNNGIATTGLFGRNINPLDGFGRSVLRDYNEWGNLQVPFARGYSGSNSGRALTPTAISRRVNAMSTVHRDAHITEAPLPPLLRQMIRNAPRGRR